MLWRSLAVLALLLSGFMAPAMAANADQPHQNVDKRNDAGNDTGDSRVESLNRGQLDRNQGAVPQQGGERPATEAPRR